jgi:hypothetical protein
MWRAVTSVIVKAEYNLSRTSQCAWDESVHIVNTKVGHDDSCAEGMRSNLRLHKAWIRKHNVSGVVVISLDETRGHDWCSDGGGRYRYIGQD